MPQRIYVGAMMNNDIEKIKTDMLNAEEGC